MTDVSFVNFYRAARFYDATRRVDDAELTQTLELLSRTLGLHDSTLEIGVGTGTLALPLAGQGWSLTGVDISAAMLSRLIEKADGRHPLALVRSDATALHERAGAMGFDPPCLERRRFGSERSS